MTLYPTKGSSCNCSFEKASVHTQATVLQVNQVNQ